ncbi:MAG: hypothetical protein D6808_03670, partial [Candidatus Dadabacteria bacterium]
VQNNAAAAEELTASGQELVKEAKLQGEIVQQLVRLLYSQGQDLSPEASFVGETTIKVIGDENGKANESISSFGDSNFDRDGSAKLH